MKDLQHHFQSSVSPKTYHSEDVKDAIKHISTKCPKSAGNTAHIKLLQGEKSTYKELLLAKCASCVGNYIDGRSDCEVATCPAYPKMQYRKKGDFYLPDNFMQPELKYIKKLCPKSEGNTACVKLLNGGQLTYRETLLALCAQCCNYHKDGRYDCEVFDCVLHSRMPYRDKYDPIHSEYYVCNASSNGAKSSSRGVGNE